MSIIPVSLDFNQFKLNSGCKEGKSFNFESLIKANKSGYDESTLFGNISYTNDLNKFSEQVTQKPNNNSIENSNTFNFEDLKKEKIKQCKKDNICSMNPATRFCNRNTKVHKKFSDIETSTKKASKNLNFMNVRQSKSSGKSCKLVKSQSKCKELDIMDTDSKVSKTYTKNHSIPMHLSLHKANKKSAKILKEIPTDSNFIKFSQDIKTYRSYGSPRNEKKLRNSPIHNNLDNESSNCKKLRFLSRDNSYFNLSRMNFSSNHERSPSNKKKSLKNMNEYCYNLKRKSLKSSTNDGEPSNLQENVNGLKVVNFGMAKKSKDIMNAPNNAKKFNSFANTLKDISKNYSKKKNTFLKSKEPNDNEFSVYKNTEMDLSQDLCIKITDDQKELQKTDTKNPVCTPYKKLDKKEDYEKNNDSPVLFCMSDVKCNDNTISKICQKIIEKPMKENMSTDQKKINSQRNTINSVNRFDSENILKENHNSNFKKEVLYQNSANKSERLNHSQTDANLKIQKENQIFKSSSNIKALKSSERTDIIKAKRNSNNS